MSRYPTVVWTGSEFAVAWTTTGSTTVQNVDKHSVFLAVVGLAGNVPMATKQLLTRSTYPHVALASSGEEIALSWVQRKEPSGTALYFQQYDKSIEPVGKMVKVSDEQPNECGAPSMVFAGDGYGITWHDDRDPDGTKIYFDFITCGGLGPEAIKAYTERIEGKRADITIVIEEEEELDKEEENDEDKNTESGLKKVFK